MCDLDEDDADKYQLDLEVDTKLSDDEDFNIEAFDENRNKKRSMRRSFGSSTVGSTSQGSQASSQPIDNSVQQTQVNLDKNAKNKKSANNERQQPVKQVKERQKRGTKRGTNRTASAKKTSSENLNNDQITINDSKGTENLRRGREKYQMNQENGELQDGSSLTLGIDNAHQVPKASDVSPTDSESSRQTKSASLHVHDAPSGPTASNQTPTVTTLNKSIKNDYKIWLQIVNDNKLSRHNPFQLKLIDYMTEMCTSSDNKNNFQFAASSVDAGARIYAKKVDKAHEDAFRVLKEVNSKKFKQQSKGDQRVDLENLNDRGGDVDNGGQVNDDSDFTSNQINSTTSTDPENKAKKRKKPRKKSNFIMSAEKDDNMIRKTKNSIVNPNLRYQYILNSMSSTSIGDLNHMPVTNDLTSNDSNIPLNLLQFFTQKNSLAKQANKSTTEKNLPQKQVPKRVLKAYLPLASKMIINESVYRDNFCSRLKCINLNRNEDAGVYYKKTNEGLLDIFVREDNLAPTFGDKFGVVDSPTGENLDATLTTDQEHTLFRSESPNLSENGMPQGDGIDMGMDVDVDADNDPNAPTPISQNLELAYNTTAALASQLTQNLTTVPEVDDLDDGCSADEMMVDDSCDNLHVDADHGSSSNCPAADPNSDRNSNFLMSSQQRQENADQNFKNIDNFASEFAAQQANFADFDDFDTVNFSQKSNQMLKNMRAAVGSKVGDIRYDQLMKVKSFKPATAANLGITEIGSSTIFLENSENLNSSSKKKLKDKAIIGIDFDETIPLSMVGINLNESIKLKQKRSTNYSFSTQQIRKHVKESRLRIVKDPNFDPEIWEQKLLRLNNFPDVLISGSTSCTGFETGYESDDLSHIHVNYQNAAALAEVDEILTQMNQGEDDDFMASRENDHQVNFRTNLSYLPCDNIVDELYENLPDQVSSQILNLSPTKACSTSESLKKLLATPKTPSSTRNLYRQKMLMNDVKTVDVAEIKTVMKNMINDDGVLPRKKRKAKKRKKTNAGGNSKMQKQLQKPLKDISEEQNSLQNFDGIDDSTSMSTVDVDFEEDCAKNDPTNYKTSSRLQVRKFSELIKKVPVSKNLQKTSKKDLSVPIMFNLLLHLANEQQLHIQNLDRHFDDLDIISPNDKD